MIDGAVESMLGWCLQLIRGGATELRMDHATAVRLLSEAGLVGVQAWTPVELDGASLLGVPIVIEEDA